MKRARAFISDRCSSFSFPSISAECVAESTRIGESVLTQHTDSGVLRSMLRRLSGFLNGSFTLFHLELRSNVQLIHEFVHPAFLGSDEKFSDRLSQVRKPA
jgi:hypothetical protein